MKTKDISGLERNQGRNFLLGFALSLAFVWMAFEWTVDDRLINAPNGGMPEFEDEIQVVRTVHPRQNTLPPPRLIRASSIIEPIEDPLFSSEPSIIDTTISQAVVNPGLPNLTVAKAILPPPRPKAEEVEAPLIISEVMPRFPGCEEVGLSKEERRICAEQKMLAFMHQHLDYPALARENGIGGTVVVQFVVEKDGTITNAKVVRDIGGGCGKEVIKVVGIMPKWVPGSQQGRKVRVLFSLPVRFEMERY